MIKADSADEQTDEQLVLSLLEATGVLVVHGSGFGADPQDGYFRLVYLANEDMLNTAFDRIGRFLSDK